MLASLACSDKNDSRSSSSKNHDWMPAAAAVSDASDDDTTIAASAPAKEIVVTRRRRRPIKKRILDCDYRSSPISSGSFPLPRESSLESSIEILRCSRKASTPDPIESRYEKAVSTPPGWSVVNDAREVDQGVPVLVCDDEAWKQMYSPLALPCFLPCPAAALRNVQSIHLTLEKP